MDATTIIQAGTAILTPLILAGVKYVQPKIPTPLLPILAGVLGGGINLIASVASHNQTSIVLSVLLGLAGVGIREIKDQLIPADPK